MALLDSLAVYRPLTHLIVPLSMFVLGVVSAWLAITDVTVGALCHGKEQCVEVIFLTTVKSAVAAFGTMFITPWVGGLSDTYGRKPFFMMLFGLFSLPFGVLAYSTTRLAVYVYFVVGTVVSMLGEGSLTTLFYAYVSDTIPEDSRAGAFGLVGGMMSLGFLSGTLITRILPGEYIFHCAAAFCLLAVLYIVFIMPESLPSIVRQREKAEEQEALKPEGPKPVRPRPTLLRSKSTVRDTIKVITNSRVLTVVTAVSFLTSVAEAGYMGSFLFYLKAVFHWSKDEFSVVTLVSGTAIGVSQLVVFPVMAHYCGMRLVLFVGLFSGAVHVVLYGIAWSPAVVYVAAALGAFSGVVHPAIGTIVSRSGMPDEQGTLQGVVAGIKSLSAFIAPLSINPITAAFLSDHPPFRCPGFGLIVAGSVELVAFFLAFALPALPPPRGQPEQCDGYTRLQATDEETPVVGGETHPCASTK